MLRAILISVVASTCALANQESAPQTQPAAAQEQQQPAWIAKFNKLPEETRRTYIAKFTEAEKLFAQKDAVSALFELTEIEKTFPDNPGLYNLMGACYIEMRDVPKAIVNFDKAYQMDPRNPTVEFNLAEAHFVHHDYKEALKRFDALLKKSDQQKTSPTYQIIQFKRLICAYKLNDKKLIKELSDIYGAMDDTPYYYYSEALKCFTAKDKKEAEENIKSALNIYAQTNVIQIFQDSLIESGYLPSVLGQTFSSELKADEGQ